MPETVTAENRASNIRAALREGILRLRDANVPSHSLAAELLLMHVLGCDRAWIYSHPDSSIGSARMEEYLALIARRAVGEPTQYLTGRQEFWGLEFEVNSHVLIPRPETEHVVEVALDRLARRGKGMTTLGYPPASELRIVDVGTGSGCIAVALARELQHAGIFAVDISETALQVARRNATKHGVADRIHFIRCDVLAALLVWAPSQLATSPSQRFFDLIVSNPPYVAREDARSLPREVRDHEPHSALFPGPTGTEIYSRLIEQSASVLTPGGILVVELGYDSASHVQSLFSGNPDWIAVEIVKDLAGISRVISAQRT